MWTIVAVASSGVNRTDVDRYLERQGKLWAGSRERSGQGSNPVVKRLRRQTARGGVQGFFNFQAKPRQGAGSTANVKTVEVFAVLLLVRRAVAAIIIIGPRK
jgi:hypothetical protein